MLDQRRSRRKSTILPIGQCQETNPISSLVTSSTLFRCIRLNSTMSLSSLANDSELQKFVAAKELENQLTAQVDSRRVNSTDLFRLCSDSSFNECLLR